MVIKYKDPNLDRSAIIEDKILFNSSYIKKIASFPSIYDFLTENNDQNSGRTATQRFLNTLIEFLGGSLLPGHFLNPTDELGAQGTCLVTHLLGCLWLAQGRQIEH